MFLALREIKHQPSRFVLIVLVITLVAYLTFFLAALAVGLAHSYRAAIDSWDARAVVLTAASNQNLNASRLSPEQIERVCQEAAAVDAQAHTLMVQGVVLERVPADGDGTAGTSQTPLRSDAFALGVGPSGPLASPPSQGSPISDPASEVLLDDSLVEDGWAVGDRLRLSGSTQVLRVVGLTHDQTLQAAGTVTIDPGTLQEALGTGGSMPPNAVVITSAQDQSPPAGLAESLDPQELELLTPAELVQTLPGYSAQVLTFTLMISALVVIAALVLGIFLYVLTLQKRPVLGVLKARGVPTRYLVASGSAQTLVLAGGGVGAGLLLVLLTGQVLPAAVPFRLSPVLTAAVTAAFVVVALLGGLISVRVVTRIDPVEAIA